MAVNLLLSYAFHAKTDLFAIRHDQVCGRLMIDSGAFTAHTKGYIIRLEDYATYLKDYEGLWDTAVTLDVINDPVTSRRNTRKLHNMGLPVMPVFTRGESIEEFDAMVKDSGYVCVGGSGGMSHKHIMQRVAALQKRAADLGGGIHALGLGSIGAIRQAAPYSCDASNAAGSFQYGTMTLFNGTRLFPVGVRKRTELKENLNLMRAHGLPAAWIIKNGKLPAVRGIDGGPSRDDVMHSIALGMATADEYLNAVVSAPVPHGVDDVPGPHLYSAVPPDALAYATTRIDRMLHYGGWNPPVWQKYAGDGHHAAQCRAKGPGAVWDRHGDGTPTGPRKPAGGLPPRYDPKNITRKPKKK